MTADSETAATEAEAPVLQPEDLSGPDAGRDPAAGSVPADGPESQPDAAEAPQEAAEPATAAAPEPAPRVSLRELQARISAPLQHAAEAVSWPDLWAQFDAAGKANAAGDSEDGRLLKAWCDQAWAATFPPRRSAVAEVMAAASAS